MQKPIVNLDVEPEIWQETLGWKPSENQRLKFQKLYEEILAGNRRLNLTRITEPEEFWEKHLWDSLAGLVGMGLTDIVEKEQHLSVIDIGTGAGFPGIPIAIAFPLWTVTLLDATRKKINFLENLLQQLEIVNAQTLLGRAEEIGRDKFQRENYDLVTIRAVGEAAVCAEYALPLLKVGGLAILYRGHWTQEENLALETAVGQLGGKIEDIPALTTPISRSVRHWIYLRKFSPTPSQFPRPVGIPSQHPLA
jgi:16S rRNA (guanine527-N7)-methyltransferase